MAPLLETIESCTEVKHIHNRVSTKDSFELALRRWGQRQYAAYSICYLAVHGSPWEIQVGPRSRLTLDDLADTLGGGANGRFLYFGSCSTLDVPVADLDAFRRATGASAVVGYRESVDWLESAAFDLLLLEAMTRFRRPREIDQWMRREHEAFCERLGFTVSRQRRRG